MSDIKHHPTSLLGLLASHTVIDIDTNDSDVAIAHNAAAAEARSSGDSTNAAVSSLFGDMTSNQLIVLSMAKQLEAADGGKGPSKLMQESAAQAKDMYARKWGDKYPSLYISDGGLGGEDEETMLEQFVVDIFTVKVGLLMLPHLKKSPASTPHLHAQTLPLSANSTDKTAAHARRLVQLYHLIGDLDKDNVCIKIPSTLQGLTASREVEREGIHTLCTAVFSVEQGLACAEACRALYMSLYVNALETHFYDAENTPVDKRRFGAQSVSQSIETIQLLERLLADPARRKKYGYSTQIMGASFSSIEEALRLAGMERMTIGGPIIATLSSTPVDADGGKWQKIVEQSVPLFKPDGGAQGEDRWASLDGDWLDGGDKAKALVSALEGERTKAMLEDALARFGKAEVELRGMARVAL